MRGRRRGARRAVGPAGRAVGRVRALAVAAAVAACAPAGAQEIGVGGVVVGTGHELLGTPMGVSAGLALPLPRGMSAALTFEGARDRFGSTGSTCVGLILPDQADGCRPEARAETGRVASLVLGLSFPALSRERVRVTVDPHYRWAWVRSEQRGERSGRSRIAEKSFSGPGVGAEAAVRAVRGRPVQVALGVRVSLLGRYEDGLIVDGYSPFEDALAVTVVSLAVRYAR